LRTVLMGLCLGLALGGAAAAQQSASSASNRLHDDLRLSVGQEGAWQQYLRAIDDGGQMQTRRQAAEQLMPQIPTPRRLALMDATMTDELAAFRRQRMAVEAFYDRLTPDQQRTFDRDTSPQGAVR
jgi:protein CpxP